MGIVWSILSYFWPFQTVMPNINLSQKEKNDLKTSWALVQQNYDASANGFFLA